MESEVLKQVKDGIKFLIFLLLLFRSWCLVGKHPCSEGSDTLNVYLGKCFRLFADTETQSNSEALCGSTWWHTSKLVSIHSQYEQDFIFDGFYTTAGMPNSYIGFEKTSPGASTYQWTDGSPHDYTATLKIQTAGDTCFYLKSNRRWDDAACTVTMARICAFNIPQCFGINGTETESVCMKRGYCIDDDECECFENYYGESCNVTECFGTFSNDSAACSGGVCVDYNNCSCPGGGYQASPCVAFYCYGIGHGEDNACSGRGNCTAENNCVCPKGYFGDQCESWNCSGVEHLNGGCSSHGECFSPENCSCNVGYYGDNCQYWNCSSMRNDDEDACSSRGNCTLSDECVCEGNYFGGDCEYFNCSMKRYDENGVCSNFGNCTDSEKCDCLFGYYGNNCQFWNCSGIERSQGACNSNGVCTFPDNCACTSGFYGVNCEFYNCSGIRNDDPTVCSNLNGTCDSPDNCTCNGDYYGGKCEKWDCFSVFYDEDSVCNDHGSCPRPDQCLCDSSYYGGACQFWNCSNIERQSGAVCESRGNCTFPEVCDCSFGFYGQYCEYYNCSGIRMDDPGVCSALNGTCVHPDNCTCNSGYYGAICEHWDCFNVHYNNDILVCSGFGSCPLPNQCVCEAGYYGENCQFWNCSNIERQDEAVCESRGNCTFPEVCDCSSGFYGGYCEYFNCSGIRMDDPSVCSYLNGTCLMPDNCTCNLGYYGDDCEHWNCFSLHRSDSSVCTNMNGTCIQPNNCSCNVGYYGEQCEDFDCFNAHKSSSTVCGRQGDCVKPDECVCYTGYYGENCKNCTCNDLFDGVSDGQYYEGNCYTMTSSMKWSEAENFCKGIHNTSHLVSILSSQELDFVSTFFTLSGDTWIGLSDILYERNFEKTGWLWADGSSGVYNNFDAIQPSTVDDCVVMEDSLFKWENEPCANSHNSMCKIKVCISGETFYPCNEENVWDNVEYEPEKVVYKAGAFCNTSIKDCPQEFYFCFSIRYNETNVCNGNAERCSSLDYCECKAGYSGDECDDWECNSNNKGSPIVCGENGKCIDKDVCNCSFPYFGNNCDEWNCSGVHKDLGEACGSSDCIGPDQCSNCTGGYYGTDCVDWKCYTYHWSSSSTCNGNGDCSSPNNCTCYTGYEDISCNKWKCYDVYEYDGSVCNNGKGVCSSPDNCTCNAGYYGDQCTEFNCNGIHFNSTDVCSGQGICPSLDTCICEDDYYGDPVDCDEFDCFGINKGNFSVCYSRGNCTDPDVCVCVTEFFGNECQYYNCSDIRMDNPSVCNYLKGSCDGPDNCTCIDGYYGGNCQYWNCSDIEHGSVDTVCTSHGSCTFPEVCDCSFGYYGQYCEYYNCSGIRMDDPATCNFLNGTCVNPDNCTCNGEYYGDNCEHWDCFGVHYYNYSRVCNGFGSCSLPNLCVCDEGYYGERCQYWNCSGFERKDDLVCNSHGNCTFPDKCKCFDEYFGGMCEYFNCSDIRMDDQSVCNTQGNCTSPEVCFCNAGYYGDICDVTTCNGIFSNETSNVCSSGAGECISFENCDCFVGNIGTYCELSYPSPSITIDYSYYVGKCSEIIISTNAIGYGLMFYWTSSLSDFVPTQLPTQFVDTDKVGVFNFSVFAVDFWGRNTTKETFEIYRTNFSLPFAYIEGPNEIIAYVKDTDFSLTGYEEILCSSGESYGYLWEQIDPISPVVNIISKNTKKLEFKNGFPFLERKYRFRFTVSSVLGNSTAEVTIDVRIRDIVALINDSSKSIPIDRVLALSSSSFDPEESAFVENFQWSCVFNGTGNCNSFVVNSDAVEFSPAKIGMYVVSLNYSKDSRWSSTSLLFTTFDGSSYSYVPEIWIDPVVYPISPSEKVTLRGNIKTHEEMSEVTFKWQCDKIPDLEDHILSDDITSLVLVVAPNSITETSVFTLKAFYEDLVVSSSVTVRVNEPPKYGVISVYPKKGKVFDEFQISFQNWIDDDLPLEYSLEYVHVISGQLKLVKPFSVDNIFQFSISTQGCRKFNYSIDLHASIRDYYGSKSSVTLQIFVEPIEFETIIEWMLFVNNYLQTETIFDKRGLDNILKIYNLINPNCTSFSTQEQLCMNYDECLSTDVPNSETLLFNRFQTYSLWYVNNFTNFFDPNQNIDQLYQIWKSIIIVQDDSDYFELIETIFDVFGEFLVFMEESVMNENIKIEMLQVFFDVVKKVYKFYSSRESPSLSIPDQEKFFSFGVKILKIFLVKLGYKEKNLYLSSSDSVLFQYLKDYAVNYKENKKLRIYEKEILFGSHIKIVIPSAISSYFELNKIVDVISINFDKYREKVLLMFMVDGEFIQIPTISTNFQILFYNQSVLANETLMCEQKVATFPSDSSDEFSNCEKTTVLDDGETIECQCNFLNAYYRVVGVKKPPDGKKNKPTYALLIAMIISLSVCVFVIICIVVFLVVLITVLISLVYVYKKRKKRKKENFVIPVDKTPESKGSLKSMKSFSSGDYVDKMEDGTMDDLESIGSATSSPPSTPSTPNSSFSMNDFANLSHNFQPMKIEVDKVEKSIDFENEDEEKVQKTLTRAVSKNLFENAKVVTKDRERVLSSSEVNFLQQLPEHEEDKIIEELSQSIEFE